MQESEGSIQPTWPSSAACKNHRPATGRGRTHATCTAQAHARRHFTHFISYFPSHFRTFRSLRLQEERGILASALTAATAAADAAVRNESIVPELETLISASTQLRSEVKACRTAA
eukprot:366444-Chlamydomonas_euryale.AAC.16